MESDREFIKRVIYKRTIKIENLKLILILIFFFFYRMEALKGLIEENHSIANIDLKNNEIKSDSSIYIAQMLDTNPNIVALDLKWN
jgi:hypothetical protein